MNAKETIVARLKSYAGLIALIGDRVYPFTLPQKCPLPGITYMMLSDPPEHAMGGDAEISPMRMQVSCLADEYDMANAVFDQVKLALSRYKADPIKDIFLETPMDDFEPETEVYQIIVEFTVFHT